ncbi:hypothetical protein Mapa_013480 [Marchantia paleacea]|nr:hypothetical protein Mapa_013480 [Marchantia paleacea]
MSMIQPLYPHAKGSLKIFSLIFPSLNRHIEQTRWMFSRMNLHQCFSIFSCVRWSGLMHHVPYYKSAQDSGFVPNRTPVSILDIW